MKLEKFEEQVFFSTVRITIQSNQGSGTSIGTGFLFRASLNDTKNRSVTLLISNKHVFVDPTQKMILNFHRKNNAAPELGQTVTFEDNSFSGAYTEHPDSSIDLACINISSISRQELNVYYKTLNPEMLCEFNEEELLPGKDVWFIGYPENRFDTAHNLPILRRGYIASIPKVNFNNRQQLIIDAQVFPGSSGSPVFTTLGANYKLLGIVTQTMVRNQQLQSVPANMALGIQEVIGLGIVLKATLIKELIDVACENIREKLLEEESEPIARE